MSKESSSLLYLFSLILSSTTLQSLGTASFFNASTYFFTCVSYLGIGHGLLPLFYQQLGTLNIYFEMSS